MSALNKSFMKVCMEQRLNHFLHRCPYFCAMFNADMKESTQSTIEINDIRFATFAAVLEYIYTDDVPSLTTDNAMDLYIAGMFTSNTSFEIYEHNNGVKN